MFEGGPVRDSMIVVAAYRFDGSSSIGGVPAVRPDRSARVEHQRIFMTPEEVKILGLTALGLNDSAVTAELEVRPSHVKHALEGIRAELGRGEEITTVEAVVIGIDAGVIQTRTLVPRDFDETVFYRLTQREAEILKALAQTGATNEELAARFKVSSFDIIERLANAYKKIEIRTEQKLFVGGKRRSAITHYKEATRRARARAVEQGIDPKEIDAFYFKPPSDLLSPREGRYIELQEQGLTYSQIAEVEKVSYWTVKSGLERAMKKLRAKTNS